MKIMITGGGALGLLIASFFSEKGHNVMVQCRTEEQADILNKKGIKRNGSIFPVEAAVNALFWEADAVIISVKQYQLQEVFNKGLPEGIPWLLIQNGMGHVEMAENRHPAPVFGVVTHGAVRTGPAEVQHTGRGNLIFGGDRKHWFTSLLEGIGDPLCAVWTPDIKIEMKKKLLVNAVVNPLTVLYETRNGYLLNNRSAEERAYRLFQEAAEVMNLPKEHWSFVKQIIIKTKDNYSSMLMDYKEKRPLELEAINGWLLKEAEKKNVPVPEHRQIVEEINEKLQRRKNR